MENSYVNQLIMNKYLLISINKEFLEDFLKSSKNSGTSQKDHMTVAANKLW